MSLSDFANETAREVAEEEYDATKADIIKTWPAFMDPRKVEKIFAYPHTHKYFSLGRGKPKQEIKRIWFTHRGRIVGCFDVLRIVKNDGVSIPKLRSLENRESEWQFKPDVWVVVCSGIGYCAMDEVVYHESFRGWRYFDLAQYRKTPDAKINYEAKD